MPSQKRSCLSYATKHVNIMKLRKAGESQDATILRFEISHERHTQIHETEFVQLHDKASISAVIPSLCLKELIF